MTRQLWSQILAFVQGLQNIKDLTVYKIRPGACVRELGSLMCASFTARTRWGLEGPYPGRWARLVSMIYIMTVKRAGTQALKQTKQLLYSFTIRACPCPLLAGC